MLMSVVVVLSEMQPRLTGSRATAGWLMELLAPSSPDTSEPASQTIRVAGAMTLLPPLLQLQLLPQLQLLLLLAQQLHMQLSTLLTLGLSAMAAGCSQASGLLSCRAGDLDSWCSQQRVSPAAYTSDPALSPTGSGSSSNSRCVRWAVEMAGARAEMLHVKSAVSCGIGQVCRLETGTGLQGIQGLVRGRC